MFFADIYFVPFCSTLRNVEIPAFLSHPAMRAYRSRIITYDFRGQIHDVQGYLHVKDGRVVGVENSPRDGAEIVDYRDHVIIPGFVDTHVHLPQVNIRAKWKPNLLEWLENYVFPEETRFLDPEYTRRNAEKFFVNLARNGTTTAMVYGPPNAESTEVAFEVARESGLRILMGQTLMDQNVPEELITPVERAERDVMELARKWNSGKLNYVLTLRFAPACSMDLMRRTADIARKLGLRIQTHISEQKDEVALVREMYGDDYAFVYDKAGVLTPKTVLAHAIHLSPEEMSLISSRGSKIAHCPSSNFFLHSGRMPIHEIQSHGIDVGLGSDVAAGPYFCMMEVSRDACYMNPISPERAFYLATMGGAKVLGLENSIGSLEPGRDADFVVVDIDSTDSTMEVLSRLVFLGHAGRIVATYSSGHAVWER